METKNPKIEKSDQRVWSLEELSGQAKSYSCSFCKKGFSNAQALGGHMNIHRKDRAKLRESSEENILSLDIVKTTNSPDDHSQVSDIIVLESSEEKSSGSTPKRPSKLSREDDGASASASSRDQSDVNKTSGKNEESSLQMIHGWSTSQIELDLELRLGPEPHQNQPRRKSTKEFF